MTPEQENHLAAIQHGIHQKIEEKYRRGQAEHQDNLWERNPVKEISEEVTDLVSYVHCIEEERKEIIQRLLSIKGNLDIGNEFDEISIELGKLIHFLER